MVCFHEFTPNVHWEPLLIRCLGLPGLIVPAVSADAEEATRLYNGVAVFKSCCPRVVLLDTVFYRGERSSLGYTLGQFSNKASPISAIKISQE